MGELQKYQHVNQCETPEQLYQCILDFADENGQIQGRTRKFDAQQMADGAKSYFDKISPANVITREYGLRQQAMYIKYYTFN